MGSSSSRMFISRRIYKQQQQIKKAKSMLKKKKQGRGVNKANAQIYRNQRKADDVDDWLAYRYSQRYHYYYDDYNGIGRRHRFKIDRDDGGGGDLEADGEDYEIDFSEDSGSDGGGDFGGGGDTGGDVDGGGGLFGDFDIGSWVGGIDFGGGDFDGGDFGGDWGGD